MNGAFQEKLPEGGLTVERRWVLKSFTAMGLLTMISGKIFDTETPAGGSGKTLDWKAFIEESVPVAKAAYGKGDVQQDAYLYRLAAFASRLTETPAPDWKPFGTTGFFYDMAHFGSPFIVAQWRLEPGGYQWPHNHFNHSVLSLCLEGETHIRHFEFVGDPPPQNSKKNFLIRETVRKVLKPGRLSTLSSVRDNIHAFQAGKQGARGLDIISLHGEMGPSSFMQLNQKPFDPEKLEYEAVWAGTDPK